MESPTRAISWLMLRIIFCFSSTDFLPCRSCSRSLSCEMMPSICGFKNAPKSEYEDPLALLNSRCARASALRALSATRRSSSPSSTTMETIKGTAQLVMIDSTVTS